MPTAKFSIRLLRTALVLSAWPIASLALAQVDVEAVPGKPFGVGRISLRLDADALVGLSGQDALEVSEKNGRVLYPAMSGGVVAQALDEIVELPGRMTVYFLFTGDEPLELTLQTPAARRLTVAPQGRARNHTRLLRQWWRQYNAAASQATSQHHTLVDHYLVAMLADRLDLAPTPLGGRMFREQPSERGLDLLLGTDAMRVAMFNRALRPGTSRPVVDQPLPKLAAVEPVGAPQPAKDLDKDVVIEPIAMHVPAECFYVRTGTFGNYRWMRLLLDDLGGDLRNLIRAQGVDYRQNERLERTLAIKESALASLLGERVVADVAIVGHDTFFREGPAFGILFQARSSLLLAGEIAGHRKAAMSGPHRAKESKVKIGGREVSFLSSADGGVRSYYAVDGDYHLLTTSETIVRRFFEAGEGKGALGASAAFQHARTLMPVDRQDAVFVYLSEAFFRNLTSPHYRVEMARRLQSATELEMVRYARLAAKAEGRPSAVIDELISGRFLPAGFGQRADGSRIMMDKDGSVSDSLRGSPGSFVPVSDVAVSGLTADEARDYRQFDELYRGAVGRMEPVMIGVGRFATREKNIERISIDARIAPFTDVGYRQLAAMLGPPTRQAIAPGPRDLAFAQLALSESSGDTDRKPEPRYLFFALSDPRRPIDLGNGSWLDWITLVPQISGYAGSWPDSGPVARVFGVDRWPDESEGFVRILGDIGLWFGKTKRFTVVALNKNDLAEATRRIDFTDADRPAQLRLHLKDLTGTNLSEALNAFGYNRSKGASVANGRLAHHLCRQFHLPRKEGMPLAQQIAGANLVCPLGGKYELARRDDGLSSWVSTAWYDKSGKAVENRPDDFVATPLRWLRGLNADALLGQNVLEVHADVWLYRPASEGLALPSLTPKALTPKAPETPEELPVPDKSPKKAPPGE